VSGHQPHPWLRQPGGPTTAEAIDDDVLAAMRRRATDPEVQARLAEILDRPKHAAGEQGIAPPSPPRRRRALATAGSAAQIDRPADAAPAGRLPAQLRRGRAT